MARVIPLDPGRRNLRWDCVERGCFKKLCLYRFEHFDSCFPRGVGFTDIDALAELGGHVLLCEFKRPGVDVPRGQSLAFERLTLGPRSITPVVATVDYETGEIFGFQTFSNGRPGPWKSTDFDNFKRRVSRWAAWAAPDRAAP